MINYSVHDRKIPRFTPASLCSHRCVYVSELLRSGNQQGSAYSLHRSCTNTSSQKCEVASSVREALSLTCKYHS